jgi:hypothetical protein
MKKLIIVAIALFTLNVSATEKPIKPNEVLRSEIVEIIGPNYADDFNNELFTVEVLFTINSKSEIIVLSANSENKVIESFIKNKLNYKKVNYKSNKVGELFLLPVTFKKS